MGKESGVPQQPIEGGAERTLSFGEIEALSKRTGGAAILPFDLQGNPDYALQQEAVGIRYKNDTQPARERVITAARQAQAITVGEPIELPPTGLAATIPDISGWKFLPGFITLPSDAVRLRALTSIAKTYEEEEIQEIMHDLAEGIDVGEGKIYYAPFYRDALDTQRDITEHVERLRTEVLENTEVTIFTPEQRRVVETTKELRGKRLPMYTAAALNARFDHDSGDCDTILNEVNFKGERGSVLAQKGEFVLLKTPDSHAWVPAVHLTDYEQSLYEDTEPKPLTPQAFLNHFVTRNDGRPYRWAAEDCSSLVSKSSRESNGFQWGKNSGEIGDRLGKFIGSERIIRHINGLSLKEGLYHLDMGYIFEQNGEKAYGGSSHMWLCAVVKDANGKLIYHAYSTAFQLKNGDGEVETPVGMHKTDKKALGRYISKDHRAIRAVKIAEPNKTTKKTSELTEESG